MAWTWTIENVRANPSMMTGDSGSAFLPWLIDKIGLRGDGLNVFLRKIGLILEMFKRMENSNS